MTQKKTYSIECPKCGDKQDVELFDSLNVHDEPALKENLMKNQINQVDCAGCGYNFRVDKPVLYSDPAQNFIIFLNPTRESPTAEEQRMFVQWMEQVNTTLPDGIDAPEVHLVTSRTELVERIFILENDLEARIIEYVKHTIYSRNLSKVDPEKKILLFDAQDSTEEKLCFVVQDSSSHQLESVIEYNRDAYVGLCEMFDQDDQTPSLMELFPGPYISARALLLAEKAV